MCLIQDEEESKKEEKKSDYYVQYKILEVFHPVDEKDTDTQSKRKQFEESLMPKSMKNGTDKISPPSKKYEWDHEKK